MESIQELLPYLCAEQSTRWGDNDHVLVEELVERYPEITNDRSALLDLIYHEIYLREIHALEIFVEDFSSRFPELREEIMLMLEVHDLVDTGHLEIADELQTFIEGTDIPDPETDVFKLISSTYPLSELPVEVIKRLGAQCIYRVIDDGDYVFRQGDASDALLIIKSGEVEIRLHHDEHSNEIVARCGPNSIIGEIGVFTNSARSADAIALGQVVVLEVSLNLYEQLNRDFPATSGLIANQISERVGNHDVDVFSSKVMHGYRIIERLGRGSMGVVYLAERVKDGDLFALKMLRHDILCNPKACQRFKQEADILGHLNHPAIRKTYEAFSAMATMFLVMEYCEGISLRKWLDQHPISDITTIKHIVGQLIDALVYAHQKEIIHRDVKPANIMIDDDSNISLMDFGLARNAINPSLTTTGELLGSPRYMAIEQFTGGAVGPKSDFFSVGCILYEMLTGEPLFDGNDLVGMLTQRMQWQLPDQHDIRPDLDDGTYAFLCSCLQSERRERLADYSSDRLKQLAREWMTC